MRNIALVFAGNELTDEQLAGLDLDYFRDLPNASAASRALEIVANPALVMQLCRNHSEADIASMKRAAFRACIKYGVPMPSRCLSQARLLGIILP